MVPNGIIHPKTDSNFMYLYTEAMVAENKFEVIRKTDDLYHSEILDELLSIQTFYEKQVRSRFGDQIPFIQAESFRRIPRARCGN